MRRPWPLKLQDDLPLGRGRTSNRSNRGEAAPGWPPAASAPVSRHRTSRWLPVWSSTRPRPATLSWLSRSGRIQARESLGADLRRMLQEADFPHVRARPVQGERQGKVHFELILRGAKAPGGAPFLRRRRRRHSWTPHCNTRPPSVRPSKVDHGAGELWTKAMVPEQGLNPRRRGFTATVSWPTIPSPNARTISVGAPVTWRGSNATPATSSAAG